MKKYVILLITVILLSPSFVFSDLITFKLGYFFPRANSDLWAYEFFYLNFSKSSFQNANFYFGYEFFLSNRISLAFSAESYSREVDSFYRDYTSLVLNDEKWAFLSDYIKGLKISHDFRVGITPIQVSLKFYPKGRKTGLLPFLGGGAGLYLWSAGVKGDWINFNDEHHYYDENFNMDIPMYPTDKKAVSESKLAIGYHVFGGIMLPIVKRITLELEFKYNFAKGKFSGFFASFEPFDISGYQIDIGLNYWF